MYFPELQEWRQRLTAAMDRYHARTEDVDVNERVMALSDEIAGLTLKLKQAEQRQMALQSVSDAALSNERERSRLLRTARSMGELIQLQNETGNTWFGTIDF